MIIQRVRIGVVCDLKKTWGAENVFWSPWSIDTSIFEDHGLKRSHKIVFVGTLDPSIVGKEAI